MLTVINSTKSNVKCKFCSENDFTHKVRYYPVKNGMLPFPLHVCNSCKAFHYDTHDILIEHVLVNVFAQWRTKRDAM